MEHSSKGIFETIIDILRKANIGFSPSTNDIFKQLGEQEYKAEQSDEHTTDSNGIQQSD